jgi:hypothetical protein
MNALANSIGSHSHYASFANGQFLYFQPRKQLVQAGNFQMKMFATLLMLFAATSVPAFAANNGFYANADTGIYMLSNSPKGNLFGVRIGGGYHFNPYLGVEVGYTIFKDSTSGDCYTYLANLSTCPQDTLSASSSQLALVGNLPLSDHYGLFAKLGWATTSLDYSYSYTPCFLVFCSATTTGSGSTTKSNPVFGFGWQSAAYEPLYWRVQYENFGSIKMMIIYNNQPSTTSDIGIQVISVGLVHKF